MKKHGRLMLLIMLLTVLLAGHASADVLTAEVDLPYDVPYTYMLRSGDMLHCLTIGFHGEYAKDLTAVTLNMAAQCSALENGALVPCGDHCADFFYDRVMPNDPDSNVFSGKAVLGIVLSPQNRTYMIDRDWSVYEWTPGETETWSRLCVLDTSSFEFEERVTREFFTADGDTLYGSFIEWLDEENVRSTVFAFSLISGGCETLFTMPDINTVYPVDENHVLFVGASERRGLFGKVSCYYLYDLASGQKTLFSDETPMGLVPDGQGGWYGFHLGYESNELRHYGAEGGNGEMIAMLPKDLWESEVSLSEDRTTAYVCSLNGVLIICPLNEADEAGPPRLVLAGNLNEYQNAESLPDLMEFSAAFDGAQITTVDYPATFDDLALELVSGSDRFDLMVLELSSGNVSSLLDKGYYVDLSDQESIAAYVQSLVPTWRGECVRRDQIVGIPLNLFNLWTYMVNLDVWEEMGLEERPKTYDELFDCIEEWDSLGILDEVPLFENSTSTFGVLYDRIMLDYMGKCRREGRPIVFTDELLLHLLGRLEELRPILQVHDARNVTGDGLFFEVSVSNIVRITYLGSHAVGAENRFELLSLGLTDEGDCVESVRFSMLVINPNSKRQELAKAFLAYLAEHPTTWAQCYLLENGAVAVRAKGYEELDDQYEERMAELNEKISDAIKDGDDAVIKRWESEKQALNDEYLNMWEVRPNMAAMLARLMPYFTPLTSDGYGFLYTSCDDLTEMFLEGRIDSRTYAMRLDERMWMAEMEVNR